MNADAWIGRGLERWVDQVRRRPYWTLALALLATVAAATYTVRNLRLNMDLQAMLSEEMPSERMWEEVRRSFPETLDPLIVVIDAETPEDARALALALRDRLAAEKELFRDADVPGESEFFAKNGLLFLSTDELAALADHLAEVQPYLAELRRDPSLRGLFGLLAQAGDPNQRAGTTLDDVGPIFTRLAGAVDASSEGAEQRVSWRELVLGGEVRDEPRRIVIAQPIVDYNELIPAEATIERVKEIAREVAEQVAPGARVRVTGELALSSEELGTVMRGTTVVGLISLAAVTFILIFGLRSWRLALANSLSLSAGLVWTFAFATLAIGSLNMISVAFAVLFIGLGDDFGVHFCMRWQDLSMQGRSSAQAIRETARDVGLSLMMCAATCVIGFLAFAPTEFAGVAELGVIAAAGMVIALFTSLTVLPALIIALAPPLPRARPHLSERGLGWLATFPVRRARAVRLGALALAIACIPFVLQARFDYNPLRLRVPTAESVTAMNDLLAAKELSPWNVIALQPDRAAADRAARELRALGTVSRAITLSDYIPADQPAKLAILEDVAMFMAPPPSDGALAPPAAAEQIAALERFARVAPQEPALAGLGAAVSRFVAGLEGLPESERARRLARLESSLLGSLPDQIERIDMALAAQPIDESTLPPELVRSAVAPDGRIRVDAFPREDLGADDAALRKFADTTHDAVPEVTGLAITTVAAGRAVVRSFKQALVGAMLAIAVLLFALWRRVGDVLVALAPLALAALVVTALAVILGRPFNFANVIVLPALLGIGVDSGIHLVHRFRHADHAGDALLETSTARGVIQSTLTTLAAFGSLGLSLHPGMSSMGELLAIGLALILIANLVLIPALLTRTRPS